jgi:dTDP-glucose 4,6-dehydratase
MRTYLVIGSNCFTGSHIVDAFLERGYSVVGVSRSPEYDDIFLPYRRHSKEQFRFCQIDISRNFDALTQLIGEVKPEIVVNVAALSEVALSNSRPLEYFETNTIGTVRLANYLREATYLERYIHISSAEVYGACEKPADETALFAPSSPYAVSKAAADMYLTTLGRNLSFPFTSIRSTNVYGKHQQLFKIIPRTAIYLRQGKKIELHGGGRAVKAFVHIRDVVDGLLRVLDSPSPGEVYHFSSDDSRTVRDIVFLVCRLMGHDPETATAIVGERLGQDARYWLNWARAERELGWRPRTDFDDGVAETIKWVEDSWGRIQDHSLEYVHRV